MKNRFWAKLPIPYCTYLNTGENHIKKSHIFILVIFKTQNFILIKAAVLAFI